MNRFTTACLSVSMCISMVTAALADGAKITVAHTLDGARPGEVIAIPFADVLKVLPQARMYHLEVRDRTGHSLPVQVTNYKHDHRGAQYDDLVFQYDFGPGEKTAAFTLEVVEDATLPFAPRVFARFVPERLDDFAWENDRIAHRIYGPALNNPVAGGERLRGSGIDLWGKRVSYPIIDRWYLKGHDQFHEDREGEGLDLYSVGESRGAGGTGIWHSGTLITSDNFSAQRVLANGPLRAVFEVDYAAWVVGGKNVAETKRFTIDAGRNFDQITSTLSFEGSDARVFGIGITHHPDVASHVSKGPNQRWLSVWEQSKEGGLGIAVILAPDAEAAGFAEEPLGSSGKFGNYLLLVRAQSDRPVHYFVGAGWDRSGQFASRESWETYVAKFAARVQDPLQVSIEATP